MASFPNFHLSQLSTLRTIDPNTVRFSQNSISNTFRDGGRIDDLAHALRDGVVKANEVQPIRLVSRDNMLFTLDNRRLEAFRKAGIQVPYRLATAEEIFAEAWKFTSINDGISIRIRGK